MHYISNLFDKVIYMFRTCPLSIIRRISTLYTRSRYCHACSVGVCQRGQDNHTSRRQQNQNDKYLLRVYSVEILPMMDSGHVRNMQSTLSNKYEIQGISLAFIIRIYHDARSSECQTVFQCYNTTTRYDSTQQISFAWIRVAYIHYMDPCVTQTIECGKSHKYTILHNFYSVKYHQHF